MRPQSGNALAQPICLALLVIGLIGPGTAMAEDCYSCGSDECCTEASSTTAGYDTCIHDTLCYLGCSCNDCFVSGNSCVGTAPPECDSPHGACEEHQTMKTVPNGEGVDFENFVDPPVAGDSILTSTPPLSLCSRG